MTIQQIKKSICESSLFNLISNYKKTLIVVIILIIFPSCTQENTYWEKINKINTIESYNNYLIRYPNGKYSLEAKKKIEEFIWNNIKKENTLEGYENYLSTYPSGSYTQEANAKIETLQWELAEKANTIYSYQKYLDLYPTGKYAILAKEKIEDLTWENAKKENTKSSYLNYLNLFPSGKYTQSAKELLILNSIQINKKQTFINSQDLNIELPYEIWIVQILKYADLEHIIGSLWDIEVKFRSLGNRYPQGFLYTGAEISTSITYQKHSKKLTETQYKRKEPPTSLPPQYLPDLLPLSPNDAPIAELAEKTIKVATIKILFQIQGIDTIILMSKDSNPINRESVFIVLSTLKHPKLSVIFCEGLNDHFWEIRKISAQALSTLKDPTTIDCLLNSLNDINEEVKKTVISTLGDFKNNTAIEPLLNLLIKEKKTDIQEVIISSLQNIDPKWNQSELAQQKIPWLINKLIEKEPEVRQTSLFILNKINPSWTKSDYTQQKIPELINLLHSPDPITRELTIDLLGNLKNQNSIGPLINLIVDTDPQIRKNALYTLSRINHKWYRTPQAQQKIPLLVNSLLSPDPQINEIALWTLNRISTKWSQRREIKPRLIFFIDALLNDNPNIRKSALKSLPYFNYRWFDTPEARSRRENFINALESDDLGKKLTSIYVLGEFREEKDIEILLNSLLTENPQIRTEIHRALSKINSKWYKSTIAKKKIPDFIDALRKDKSEIRKTALETLIKITGVNFKENYDKWQSWWINQSNIKETEGKKLPNKS